MSSSPSVSERHCGVCSQLTVNDTTIPAIRIMPKDFVVKIPIPKGSQQGVTRTSFPVPIRRAPIAPKLLPKRKRTPEVFPTTRPYTKRDVTQKSPASFLSIPPPKRRREQTVLTTDSGRKRSLKRRKPPSPVPVSSSEEEVDFDPFAPLKNRRKVKNPYSDNEEESEGVPKPKPIPTPKQKRIYPGRRKVSSEAAPILDRQQLAKEREELRNHTMSKNTRRNLVKYAKKFKGVNRLDDWNHVTIVPPKRYLKNIYLENFITQVWAEKRAKPNVQQGRKYLNHVLAHHGMPPLNRNFKRNYASVLEVLSPIMKSQEWRDYVTRGAGTYNLSQVMDVFRAKVTNEEGELEVKALRNKVIACLMIIMGCHPIDIWRIHEDNVEDRPTHVDREDYHRPKMIFDGFHTKDHGFGTTNVIGCGCRRNHDWDNDLCLYNVLRHYIKVKKAHDKDFLLRHVPKLRPSKPETQTISGL